MRFDPKAAFKPKSLLVALFISLDGGLIYERGTGALRIALFTVLFFAVLELLIVIKLMLFATR